MVQSLNTTSVQPKEQSKQSSSNITIGHCLGVGGAIGMAGDMYFNNTKTSPKKYLQQIEEIEKELNAKSISTDLRDTIIRAKERLTEIITKKYGIIKNFFDNAIIEDAGDALSPLSKFETPKELSKTKESFEKLSAIGKEHSLDGNVFAKAFKRPFKQAKLTILGAVLGLLGGLIYKQSSKSA